MRLTSVKAANILTFEDFHLDVNPEGVSVLVGPNGAGKTNVFRAVRSILDAFRTYALYDSNVTVTDRLTAWIRDPSQEATIELGVRWDAKEEKELIAEFVRASVADSGEFLGGIGPVNGGSQWDREPYRGRWRESVNESVSAQGLDVLYGGCVGLHVNAENPMGEHALYFRPSTESDWIWVLNRTNYLSDGLLRSTSGWRLHN